MADTVISQDATTKLKNVVCTSCDGFCPVALKTTEGRVTKITTRDHPLFKDVLCMKGAYAHKGFAHPDRLMHPLKRVGARGDNNWQQVTWDQAMDDIAERLQKTISQYGPEAFAVASSNANIGNDNGLSRRFMNAVGSPNWIGGVAYCMGNTAAVNRMVYGWYPRGDVLNSKCIMLFGHDPRRHSWTMEYKSIRMAQANGAKLIVADPRRSENAEKADIWLPLRSGTDAALSLGMVKLIVDEELYDKDFVRDWCVGFDQLKERLEEYPLERVAEITGCKAEDIAAAARIYAMAERACIPWSPITDQQVSSTSAIRLQCILRALTGNIDVKGGELFVGFNQKMLSDTEVERHDWLSPEQQAKQLGSAEYPVFTYRGMEALKEPTKRVWGHEYANLVSGCYMANPMNVFKAMATDDPYPIRSFFALANNTLMSFANTHRIYKALMRQDLIVSFEHMMTPTGQISDYVLPGNAWIERSQMMAGVSGKGMEPPGECQDITYFWHELAKRMGMEDVIPWSTSDAVHDFRLEPSGKTWEEVLSDGRTPKSSNSERKYLETGFATPSGKVELYSSVLDELGFDPLPYYREAPQPNDEFPMTLFIGMPDDEYYRTGHRFIPELRARAKDPTFFLSEGDAVAMDIGEGDWVRVTTSNGTMVARVFVRSSMPKGLVRVPHGWWKPEAAFNMKSMSGMWHYSDAQLTPDDDPDWLDAEQGIPHMKGMRCAVEKLSTEEVAALEAEYGKTDKLPRGPEGKVLRSDAKTTDFMFDPDVGDGVEFEAVELSIYGRTTL